MMTDIEKFKKLTKEIDVMLPSRIDPSSEEFTSWQTKVERLLDRIYGSDSKEAKSDIQSVHRRIGREFTRFGTTRRI